jgi:triphosphoribosyl-dephospho-CoA synthetase
MPNSVDPMKFVEDCCREALANGDRSWSAVRAVIDRKLNEMNEFDRECINQQLLLMVGSEEDQRRSPSVH